VYCYYYSTIDVFRSKLGSTFAFQDAGSWRDYMVAAQRGGPRQAPRAPRAATGSEIADAGATGTEGMF